MLSYDNYLAYSANSRRMLLITCSHYTALLTIWSGSGRRWRN